MRDNILLFLGLCVLYISEGILYIGTGSHNIIIYFVVSVFIAPTIQTNREVALKFHQINRNKMLNNELD